MLEMPNATITFAMSSKRATQVEILENALEHETDTYMRIVVKSAIDRLRGGEKR